MPVPDKLWLSAEKVEPEGVYLLENGFEAWVFVGKSVDPATCQALFGERGREQSAVHRRWTALPNFSGRLQPSHHCVAYSNVSSHPLPNLPIGLPSLEALDPQQAVPLPALDTPLSRKVHALLNEVRRQRSAYLRLRVVRRGDAATEPAFYAALVEDRSPISGASYVEYLCFLHRQIQNKLA